MRIYLYVLLFSLSIFLPFSLNGQISKGATIQFGAADLSYGLQGGSSFETGLSYGLLYLITDHWALGGGLGAFSSSDLNGGAGGMIPTARYYFNPAATNLNWFATAGVGFDLTFGSNTQLSLDQWIVGGGFNHFLNKNIIFETSANLTFGPAYRGSPEFNIGTGLLVYLSREDRQNRKDVLPAIGKGSLLIGLNEVGLSYRPADRDFSFSAVLQPNLGYFFTNRWMAGLGLRIGYSDFRFNSEFPENQFEYSAFTFGLNSFTRYYFGNQTKRLRPFAHAEVGFVSTSTNFLQANQGTEKASESWLTTRFGLGANLFLSPEVALEGNLTYSSDKDQSLFNEFRNQQRIGFNVGLQFFLSRSKDD